MAGASGMLYWLPQIIRHLSAGSSDLEVGFIAALPWVAVAAGMLLNAWHSDRVQERHWHVALPALAAGFFIALTPLLGTGAGARFNFPFSVAVFVQSLDPRSKIST